MRGVDAEARCSQERLEFGRDVDLFTCYDCCGRKISGNFDSEVRAGENGNGAVRENVSENLAHSHPSLVFDALRAREHGQIGIRIHISKMSRDRAERGRGRRKNNQRGIRTIL